MAAATTERSASPAATGFGLPRLIPSLPMNMFNSINPFAAPETDKQTQETKETETTFFKRPIFGAILSRPAVTATEQHSHHRNESTTVMFAEPVITDSDDASREGSVSNEAQRRRRSRTKPKTTFSICHPPPASLTRHKLHRRPRSLLQLHRLCGNARPVPAYEVIPSANFSARLTKNIIKTYKTRHGLCYNDLVVLRAEKYYTEDHEQEQDSQDILALICRGRATETSTKDKICMSSGEEWEAYNHTSGGYEFFTTDAHGLGITVRWVPKRNKAGQKRFNFSTIAQNTRKHPVIASLSETGLDVYDTYKIPDPAVSTPLSTPVHTDSFLTQAMEDEESPTNDECATDERLRSIITVTAIFVAFKEGWSPYFKYDDKEAVKSGSPRKDSLTTPVSTPPGSPMQKGLEKRGSMRSVSSGLLRRSSMLSRSNRDSTLSVDSIVSSDASAATKTGRARSDSASTVLVHRAASNRRRNNQQATWRPDLLSVQNSVPETSREDLARSLPGRLAVIDKKNISRKESVNDDTAEEEETDDDEEVEPERKKDDKSSSAPSDVPSEPSRSTPTVMEHSSTRKPSRWRRFLCIG